MARNGTTGGRHGGGGMVPVPPRVRSDRLPMPLRLWLNRNWYFVITVLSAGLLAWIPFLHAASRLHERRHRLFAAGYGAAAIVLLVLFSVAPKDGHGDVKTGTALGTISMALSLVVIVAACVQLAGVRRAVRQGPPPAPSVDPAIAAALAARAKRAEARQLAESDPLLAREIHIGRPDVTRGYDDGGLVDLNAAPAGVIAQVCAIARGTAESIVAARPEGTGYLAVDDVFVVADIPVGAWNRIRDHAVVLPA